MQTSPSGKHSPGTRPRTRREIGIGGYRQLSPVPDGNKQAAPIRAAALPSRGVHTATQPTRPFSCPREATGAGALGPEEPELELELESESEQNQKQMPGPVDVHRRQTVAAMGMVARAASRRRSGTAQLRVASPRRSMI